MELFNLDQMEKENRPLSVTFSRNTLGRIVFDLWGSAHVHSKTLGKRGERRVSGYFNLSKKSSPQPSRNCDVDLSNVPKNWTIVQKEAFSVSFMRAEAKAFNGQQVIKEISVKLGQDEDIIELKCQGFSLCTDDLGLQAEIKESAFQIKSI